QRLAGYQRLLRTMDRVFQSTGLISAVQCHRSVGHHGVGLSRCALRFKYVQKYLCRMLHRVAAMKFCWRRGRKSEVGGLSDLFAAVEEIFVGSCQRYFVVAIE